ncbi:MAG: type I-E CRISPR-associated protein Cas5/CasD [Planctomycetes bacterium]|nr:type I-E CRISPR-associated protein Cas5/CasD [Planctomycetota bacterium]
MRALILRLEGPLLSFGGPTVDQNGVTQRMPATSMLTGLLGNALGYSHGDAAALQSLQDRIRFAARSDRPGEPVVDYQIVDLGQPWMDGKANGWTTRGRLAGRGGGSSDKLHIRHRHYQADSVYTVALTLDPPDDAPDLDRIAAAMLQPARPLFIGRKTCLPATPIFVRIAEAPSVLHALADEPRGRRTVAGPLAAWWDDGLDESGLAVAPHSIATTDERDWQNQVHTGRRILREGRLDPPGARDV